MIRTSQAEGKATESAVGNRNVVCWNEDQNTQALRVELPDGKIFILPISHLLAAAFSREDRHDDKLELTFSTHRVTLRGRHLREIALALHKLAVDWIKTVAPKYAPLADPKAALIVSIEVTTLEDAAAPEGREGSL